MHSVLVLHASCGIGRSPSAWACFPFCPRADPSTGGAFHRALPCPAPTELLLDRRQSDGEMCELVERDNRSKVGLVQADRMCAQGSACGRPSQHLTPRLSMPPGSPTHSNTRPGPARVQNGRVYLLPPRGESGRPDSLRAVAVPVFAATPR